MPFSLLWRVGWWGVEGEGVGGVEVEGWWGGEGDSLSLLVCSLSSNFVSFWSLKDSVV